MKTTILRLTLSFLFLLLYSHLFAIEGIIIKTTDYSFGEKWYNTLGSSIPHIYECENVYRGQNFFITAIASDYQLDKNQFANLTYSVKIFKPDNTIYLSKENLLLINSKISNPDFLQMGNAIIKNSFAGNDVLGKYKIEIQIKDLIGNKSKILNSEINLIEIPSYESFQIKTDKEFTDWLNQYFKNPSPEDALSYYIYYSKSKYSENDSSFWPVIGFFKELFENNKFLYPEIVKSYQTVDLKTKIYLLYLLEYSKLGDEDFFAGLDGEEKDAYLNIKQSHLPDIYDNIESPEQLDMLWGTFYASGSYKPIYKLIQTLDFVEYKGSLEKYKISEQKTEDEMQRAVKDAIYESLVWSIGSHCRQYELVLNYCNWAYHYGELNDIQKTELSKILYK